MSLYRRVAIAGIGETAYARRSSRTSLELQLEASLAAISDAGLQPADIDGVVPVAASPAEQYVINLGISDLRFSAVVPHGGASGVGALQLAAAAVHAGICSHVLVPTGQNVSSGPRTGARIHEMPQFHLVTEFERPLGAYAPAQLYAPMAQRHMQLYGTTSQHLGEIAVSTRMHAGRNPNAIMTSPISLEDHQRSRMITEPFRLLDCSLETDGGAAFVVSSVERARDLRRPVVELLGVAMGHPDSPDSITQRDDVTSLGVRRAAPIAFEMAGVTHDDIDVAEVYDCFTFIVLCQLEELGFCRTGEGGDFVSSGRLRPGGDLPTNTHGGLLSQAHMLGMNHIVELVRQLRGDAGPAQVAGARTGLVTGYGDLGDGGVAILARAGGS